MKAGADEAPRPANRLAAESSPYLLQHAHNPVDWYPWGAEAFARARSENKPVLLSVGYSACHWCHVMERESFENDSIAALMNENFVSVKVDREERPDVDAIYMDAVQRLSGHGGWPMTVFLTPQGLPFYGGTYYPPSDRHGMPGFPRLLTSIANSYRQNRAQIEEGALELSHQLGNSLEIPSSGESEGRGIEGIDPALLTASAKRLIQAIDRHHGGVGGAPKFPMPHLFEYLLRYHHASGDTEALEVVELTLRAMAEGGIYDQLGGGFHRYSTDERWLTPHFEKMLYDNAQLARLYLHAWQITGKPLYRRILEQTLAYVEREMTDSAGGFYSAQDADSEGEEGKFFVWTVAQTEAALGPERAAIFNEYYDVSEAGNFEHANILHVSRDPGDLARCTALSRVALEELLENCRDTLLAQRATRVKPLRDDKILTSWNGLALAAFAEAAAVLGRDDWRRTARRAADFLLAELRRPDGRLLRTWRDGQAKIPGYLEDYAFLADGLLWTYQATFEPRYLDAAQSLAKDMIRLFADPQGGFFDTGEDQDELISRPKNYFDNATPAGNSVAADVLLRLQAFSGDIGTGDSPRATIRALAPLMARHPSAFGCWLSALASETAGIQEVVLAGDPADPTFVALARGIFAPYVPAKVVAGGSPEVLAGLAPRWPLVANRGAVGGRPIVYVCRNSTCRAPATRAEDIWP